MLDAMKNKEPLTNPFVEKIQLPVVKVYTAPGRNRQFTLEDFDFDSEDDHFYLDQGKKTSVFFDVALIELLFKSGIGPAGRDLLLYIQLRMKADKDYIALKPKLVCEEMGIVRTTFERARSQLVDNNYILRKAMNIYWINPMLMMCGSRIKYFQALAPNNAKLRVVSKARLKPAKV